MRLRTKGQPENQEPDQGVQRNVELYSHSALPWLRVLKIAGST
jgi:hypothetical protein